MYNGGWRPKAIVHAKSKLLKKYWTYVEYSEYSKVIAKACIIWVNVFKDSMPLRDYLEKSNI